MSLRTFGNYGTNLVVGAQMAESVGKPTGLRASLNDIMWKIATMRFNVAERWMASGREESGSKSKMKGQRK